MADWYAPGTPVSPDLPPHLQGADVQVPFRLPAEAQTPPVKPPKPPTVTTTMVKQAKANLAAQGIDYNEIAAAAAAKFNIDPAQVEGLSDKDKWRMLTRMGINMMAASSRPGATTAESLASGLSGYLGEEDALKAKKMAAYKDQQAGARQAGQDAVSHAKDTEASRRGVLSDALAQQRVIQTGEQIRRQNRPQYITDSQGTVFAVTDSGATPVKTDGGLPLRKQVVNPRDVANYSAKIRQELAKSFSPNYGGRTFADLSPDEQDTVVSGIVERQFGSQTEPYGEPVGFSPEYAQ